jgi:Fe2+ transport system protein FeoA
MGPIRGGTIAGGYLRQSLFLHSLPLGAEATVERLDLPEGAAQRLQELGFVPGSRVLAAWTAPGGDPRVYRVDGAEIALRKETAAHILVATMTGEQHAA